MKLQQLRYFQAACQECNISQAAQKLHISQPSISTAIKDLEIEFGIKLVHRLSKGFILTQEGKALLGLAENLLQHADTVAQKMTDLGEKRNMIRLGVPPMIGSFLFPKIYSGFRLQYPEIKMITQETGSKNLLEGLTNGTLDIAFLPHSDSFSQEFRTTLIMKTETVYCVPRSHRFAQRDSIRIPEIKDEPLVMFKSSFFQNEVVHRQFAQYDIVPNIIHYSDQLSTFKEFIVGKIATGFMFLKIANADPDIVGIHLDPPIILDISLVWMRNHYIYTDITRFIDYITKHIKEY